MNKQAKIIIGTLTGVIIVLLIVIASLLSKTNKPKEAACKPLPIGCHRVIWNNNIGMQRIAFTA